MMTARRVPLIDLVAQGQIGEVRKLIKKGCDVNETDYCGGCAVTMCVERNDADILEVLIAANANVDVEDPLGRSALSRAKQLEHHKVAQLIEGALTQKKMAEPSVQEPQSDSKIDSFDGLRFYDKQSEKKRDELKSAKPDEELKQPTSTNQPPIIPTSGSKNSR